MSLLFFNIKKKLYFHFHNRQSQQALSLDTYFNNLFPSLGKIFLAIHFHPVHFFCCDFLFNMEDFIFLFTFI